MLGHWGWESLTQWEKRKFDLKKSYRQIFVMSKIERKILDLIASLLTASPIKSLFKEILRISNRQRDLPQTFSGANIVWRNRLRRSSSSIHTIGMQSHLNDIGFLIFKSKNDMCVPYRGSTIFRRRKVSIMSNDFRTLSVHVPACFCVD